MPLSVWKICKDLKWEKCCDHSSAFIFKWIFFILAGTCNKANHKRWDIFEFLTDSTTELAALECLKHQCFHFFLVAIDLILFKLADMEAMHNILDVFEFWPDWTTDTKVTNP